MYHRASGVNHWGTPGSHAGEPPRDQSNVVSTISYIAVCVISAPETAAAAAAEELGEYGNGDNVSIIYTGTHRNSCSIASRRLGGRDGRLPPRHAEKHIIIIVTLRTKNSISRRRGISQ